MTHGSPLLVACARWAALAAAALGLCACRPDPGPSPVLRLTPLEFNNSVRDLYGYAPGEAWPDSDGSPFQLQGEYDRPPWPYDFPPDLEVDGFDGRVEGQTSSAYQAEQFVEAARLFAAWAPIAPRFPTCTGWLERPEAEAIECGAGSVLRFAEEAWRGPLTAAEQRRLRALYDRSVAESGLLDGVRISVQAVLASPRFLYRLEQGEPEDVDQPVARLTGAEIATRLSYLLWDAPPDDALRAAAKGGALDDADRVEAQARRMLSDPRARPAVVRFHDQWLGVEDVYRARPSFLTHGQALAPELFESEDDVLNVEDQWAGLLIGLRRAMVLETQHFVEHTVFDGAGTLAALLTDSHGYVSDVRVGDRWISTQGIYGVQEGDLLAGPNHAAAFADSDFFYEIYQRPAAFPASQRAGVLTQGALLMAGSHPVHPSPIHRGQRVLERIACESLGSPPAGVSALAPPDTPEADATNRARVEAVTAAEGCAGCHARLNPPGFAFEAYDSVGAWRESDHGQPIDSAGSVVLSQGEVLRFANGVELARALSTSPQVQRCYVRRWAEVALGRGLTDEDGPWMAELVDAFDASGGSVLELLVAIARSEHFRSLRRAP